MCLPVLDAEIFVLNSSSSSRLAVHGLRLGSLRGVVVYVCEIFTARLRTHSTVRNDARFHCRLKIEIASLGSSPQFFARARSSPKRKNRGSWSMEGGGVGRLRKPNYRLVVAPARHLEAIWRRA